MDINCWEPPIEPRVWKYVVLHHSGAQSGDVEQIDAFDRLRRDQFGNAWPGIGYHFVVGNGNGMADGRAEPTFRWQQQLHGTHTGSRPHNLKGIGICLVGDFDESPPTPRQIASAKRLVEWLCGRFGLRLRNVLRHSDIAATRCPGRLFPFVELWQSLQPRVAAPAENSLEAFF